MRCNFSHATADEFHLRVGNLRKSPGGELVNLMLDTKGPEIRMGGLKVCKETGKVCFNEQQMAMHKRFVPEAQTFDESNVGELRTKALAAAAAGDQGARRPAPRDGLHRAASAKGSRQDVERRHRTGDQLARRGGGGGGGSAAARAAALSLPSLFA